MGSLLRRAHFESLRAAEAKNSATINQLKYRSRSCITENIALGAWSRANKALGCASCFIGSRPRPRAIFISMHAAEEVGTDHVSDHALRFSSDVSMELMYRLSFCRNCESLHPGVGLNGKSS